ncbi:Na(+)/H(+) antiporter subunit C [Nocardioides ginkgobilobae]|uniref:Multicomponent Na+:H+ antiporter subunit C n=1 Tax=Nocardioides panzhihuensis TaxID=860243 RepID=A0A7Z0DTR5_9ACTN|nr:MULTISPECIES: NADH-quinone oxidoreductase subunit K [Nocardioides]NYI81181.1 multicomponent Na+:H+ antiporter subunit C [Nocardioides panzhihuensis]QSR31643.1 cation:proton antiporter [Nocardioides sp. S5]
MTAAIIVGLLVAGGVWFLAQPGLLRVILGFVLLGHGVNVLLLASGGLDRRRAPFVGDGAGDPAALADPLPQAFVLTAVVITFGVSVYLLAILRAESVEDPDVSAADDMDETDEPRAGR